MTISAATGDPVRSLRILVADGDPAMRKFYEAALPALGHQVCVAASGPQAVELYRAVEPDLVITDLNLPERDGMATAAEICRVRSVPFIVVSDCHDPEIIRRAPDGPFLAYLVKPIKPTDLGPAIAVAMRSFERLRALWQEVGQLREALGDRKLIEQAKGLVMRYSGLGEEDAYQRLRKLASDQNRKLVEVAQSVITAGEVFQDLDRQGERTESGDGSARLLRRAGAHRNGTGSKPRRKVARQKD